MADKTAWKQKYLGGTFAGQDLCYYKIDIAENAVSVVRYRDGVLVSSRFFDEPGEVATIKEKLRAFVRRSRTNSRIKVEVIKPGLARIFSYYPSVSWGASTGQVRWMGEDF